MDDLPQKSTNFLLYHSESAKISIQVIVGNETVWLSQKAMAQLFDCTTDNISLHLKNIFKEGELDPDSVTEDYSITAADNKKYKTKFYRGLSKPNPLSQAIQSALLPSPLIPNAHKR